MPKFTVYYTNTEYGSIEVEAATEEEAIDNVYEMWGNGELDIYENDFEVTSADKEKE